MFLYQIPDGSWLAKVHDASMYIMLFLGFVTVVNAIGYVLTRLFFFEVGIFGLVAPIVACFKAIMIVQLYDLYLTFKS